MICLTEEMGAYHLVMESFLAFSGIITHLKICETVPLAGHTKVTKIYQIALTQNPEILHFYKDQIVQWSFMSIIIEL